MHNVIISGKLGNNIDFYVDAILVEKPLQANYRVIEKLNSYSIHGYGDMYESLYDSILDVEYTGSEDIYESFIRKIRASEVTRTINDDIVLPETITSIGSNFFGGKSIKALGVIKICDYAYSWYKYSFGEYSELGRLVKVDVAENCNIGAYAFGGSYNLESMSLMNGNIGAGAFNNCCRLNTLKFGKDVVIFEDAQSLTPIPSFYVSNGSEVYPVYTTIIGQFPQVLKYGWLRSGRIINTQKDNYKLAFQNHYNSYIGIDIDKYTNGQVKICIDGQYKTARLIEDTRNRYTGLCVVADGKIYQFMDKTTVN